MLGFLKPFALYGLAAALLPLLIHLFARPRLKKIRFSYLAFFHQIETQRAQSFKLQQFLVLLFRTLAILFLVLALARPTSRNAGPDGSAQTSACIIIDNSLSMSRNHLFESAQKHVSDILSTLHPGDEAALLFSDGTRFPVSGSTVDFESIRTALMKSNAACQHHILQKTILRAHRELQTTTHANKEIYIISDFQLPTMRVDPDSAVLSDSGIRWFAWPIKGETSNFAVTDCRIASRIMQPGAPVELMADIRNYGESSVDNALVRLSLETRTVAQQAFSVGSGQSASLRFQINPDKPGWFWGEIILDDDALIGDNQMAYAGSVPGEIQLLLIGDAASRKFVRLALEAQTSGTSFNIHGSENIPRQSLHPGIYQIIYLLDVPEITMQNAENLTNFVAQGGGLCFIPGPKTDILRFNQTLGSAFSLALQNTPKESGQRSFLTLDALNRSHPLFYGMFGEKSDFTSPRFYQTLNCTTSRKDIVQLFRNQSPFLIEKKQGAGKALFFMSGMHEAWSDFRWTAFFAPMMLRSMYYLSQSENNIPVIMCGEVLTFKLMDTNLSNEYYLEKPSGESVLLHPINRGGQFVIETDDTDKPGLYRLLRGEQVAGLGVVRTDPGESDLIPADRETIASFFPSPCHVIDENPEQTILLARWGREYWTVCLLFAVFCLLAEMAVIRWSVRQAQ